MAARRRLDDLCDGELETSAAERVSRHLEGCRRCRHVLNVLEATLDDLATLGDTKTPTVSPLGDRLVARIEAEEIDASGCSRHGAAH